MYTNVLQAIQGVAIYPIISLLIFLPFFVAVTLWVFRAKKEYIEAMSNLPLESTEYSSHTGGNHGHI